MLARAVEHPADRRALVRAQLRVPDIEEEQAALGVGVELGIMLPFSRAHEKEADVMGMMYMANAGYPPTESIDVWTRMSANRKGLEIPAFLSTHHTHKQRKQNLREWMPAAKKKFARNQLQRDTLRTLWASSR